MSVAEAAHRPAKTGRAVKLWLGFLIIIAAGIALAWVGAGSLRPEVTATGLEFRTVKAGTGDPITSADAAALDYILTLDDGTVMDSSEAHGGPQPFIMGAVFPGFAEAMGKMQEGGRYRFSMPKSLAFTDGQTPPGFKGEKLTFDVQVRRVVRGGAMMMQGAPRPQAEPEGEQSAEPQPEPQSEPQPQP
ncbi:MAG TPA: FKBP-type peptidyl-prolyl cis-trans isomerase [Sphingomicrobium sp.]|nr:FKBP-type peptidyl-prolyl cis-trans isomerase [Sphingomicrobium sp.]